MSYILFACQLMVGASAVLAVICSIGVWRSDNIRGMSIRMKPKSIRFSSNINIPSNSVGSYTTLIKTDLNEASSTTTTVEVGENLS